jgi:hypothetical protein
MQGRDDYNLILDRFEIIVTRTGGALIPFSGPEVTMARKGIITLTACALLLAGAAAAFADVVATDTIGVSINVNALAAIKVNGTAQTFTVGNIAGAAGTLPNVDSTGNVPTYIQYTSIVPAANTRQIAVQADKAVPDGLVLNIRAGTPTGNGGVGTPVAGGVSIGSAYVAGTDQDILTNITSCATGTGVTQGAPVFYTLALDEAGFTNLTTTAAAYTMTVTFTLVGP